MTSSQSKRFGKWLNLAPPQTRYLGSRVEQILVPSLERLGFVWPGASRLLVDQPVSGRELELERASGEFVDTVAFNFDKYRRPRFQINVARRAASPPHAFLRTCNIVANSSQYYYFWGAPWWFPTALWSSQRTDRLIEASESRLAQADQFLANGQTGPNISKPINLV